MDYSPPQSDEFRVDTLMLTKDGKKHFVKNITDQLSAAPSLIVVWNQLQMVFVSPDPEKDSNLAHDLCEWMKQRAK